VTRKAKVFNFISENPNATHAMWLEFQKLHPFIRIKQSSKQRTLINFSEQEAWFDPMSWAGNYQASLIERLNAAFMDCKAIHAFIPEGTELVTWFEKELNERMQSFICEFKENLQQRFSPEMISQILDAMPD